MGNTHDPQYLPGDDVLLAANLEIGDPRDLYDLVERIPEGAEIAEMVAIYNYRAEKLRCAKCYKPIHHKGYVVRLTNGQHALLGNKCGRLYFSGSFEGHLANYKHRQRRQKYLRRAAPLDHAIDKALGWLEVWEGPTGTLAHLRREFQRHHRDLYDRLAEAAHKNDGELVVPKSRKVSGSELGSTAAQIAEMKQMIRPGGGGHVPKYETTYESRGRMRGREFFFITLDPRAKVRDASVDLRVAQKKLRRPNLTTDELGRLLREVREAADKLTDARASYVAAREFLERSNLGVVVSWANEHPHVPGRYRLTKTELVGVNDWGEDARWQFVAELPDFGTEPIDALRTQQENKLVA